MPAKIDGHVEAQIIAIRTGPPPAGRARWTMDLIAGEVVRREVLGSISREEAHRLARRPEIIPTPRGGGWLNVAEIELSVLARQCLARRVGSAAGVDAECAAWERRRHAEASRAIWRFTTQDARVKLKHLYPRF